MATTTIDWAPLADTPAALEHDRIEAGEPWMTSPVAGLQYHRLGDPDGVGGYVSPAPGDRVQTIREPTNQHDQNAVRVEWRNQHMLGHLPRALARDLAPRLDRGEPLRGYVFDTGDGSPWSLKLLLVGHAVEDHHGQRLRAAFKAEVHAAVEAIWGERIPTAAQRSSAEAWSDRRRSAMARRRSDAVAAFNGLPMACPGTDLAIDESLRGRRITRWEDVPAWLRTRKQLRDLGFKPGPGGPFALKVGGYGPFELWLAHDAMPIRQRAPAVEQERYEALVL